MDEESNRNVPPSPADDTLRAWSRVTTTMGAYPTIMMSAAGASEFQLTFRPTSPYAEAGDVNVFNLGISVNVSPGATLTYQVEVTDDPVPSNTGNWVPHDTLVGKTASAVSNIDYPATAYRLRVTAYTSGSATLGVAWW
jgi:hypothetical protein